MSYPMRDMVTYKGKMYHSHLHYLFKDASWLPSDGIPGTLFDVSQTNCWHGYGIVFSAKMGKHFRPSWLLSFTPVAKAPTLKFPKTWMSEEIVVVPPQPVPETIDEAPVPKGVYNSAYCLDGFTPDFALWELGIILWCREDQCTYLLEVGERRRTIGNVISFRKLHGPPKDKMTAKEKLRFMDKMTRILEFNGPSYVYQQLKDDWDGSIERCYAKAGILLPEDQFWAVVDKHAVKTGNIVKSLMLLWQINKRTNPLLERERDT